MTIRERKQTGHPPDPPGGASNGLMEAALEISKRRAEALREIKTLLLQGEDDQALRLMKQFFGFDEQDVKGIQAGK
jgi:hypothetical protein